MTRSEMIARLVFAMGGRAAEELVFREPTTGAVSDIDQATKIARSMVTEYGMSAKLGAVKYGTEHGDPFLGRTMGTQSDYSHEVARDIDDEVRKLIEAAHTEAWAILTEYRDVLDVLAGELLEKETLHRKELEAIFAEVKKRPRLTVFDDFGGRIPSDKPPIKTPGELAIERGEPWPKPMPEPAFKTAIAEATAKAREQQGQAQRRQRRQRQRRDRPAPGAAAGARSARLRCAGGLACARLAAAAAPAGVLASRRRRAGASPSSRISPLRCRVRGLLRKTSLVRVAVGIIGRTTADDERSFDGAARSITLDTPQFDQARAEAAVRELLLAVGEDPTRHGLQDTPARVARAFRRCSPGSTPTPIRCWRPPSTNSTTSWCW